MLATISGTWASISILNPNEPDFEAFVVRGVSLEETSTRGPIERNLSTLISFFQLEKGEENG